tara:strand:+ start:906 stop:1112 length:207 start_codon:yes stop_codon:yes gene_type:complete
MHYYCTCSTNEKRKKEVSSGRTPFREVKVDEDNACLDCGYYTVAYFQKIDPTNGNLYFKVINPEKEVL